MKKNSIKKIPNHIAFIIDGNGRWAKERGLTRSMGHKAGLKNLEKIVKECFFTYGIKVVSIYAFSTENWNRPKAEVEYLMSLFREYLNKDIGETYPNVRVNIMGDHTAFDSDLSDLCSRVMEESKNNTEFILNLGLNYSGKSELVRAFNNLSKEGKDIITEEDIERHLYTANQPPLDFCVRTSGENRLSNFMLWQLAYAELYFPPVHWPAFNKTELAKALKVYEGRDRRFGAIKE